MKTHYIVWHDEGYYVGLDGKFTEFPVMLTHREANQIAKGFNESTVTVREPTLREYFSWRARRAGLVKSEAKAAHCREQGRLKHERAVAAKANHATS